MEIGTKGEAIAYLRKTYRLSAANDTRAQQVVDNWWLYVGGMRSPNYTTGSLDRFVRMTTTLERRPRRSHA